MLSKPAKTRLRALRDCGALRARWNYAGFEELAQKGLITWEYGPPRSSDWLHIRLNDEGRKVAAAVLRP